MLIDAPVDSRYTIGMANDSTNDSDTLSFVLAEIITKLGELPPIVNDDVKPDMAIMSILTSQSMLKDGNAHIEMQIQPTNLFNTFWFNKQLSLQVQVKDSGGVVDKIIEQIVTITDLQVKLIVLDIPTALKNVKIDFFFQVSLADPRPFANTVTLEMQEGVTPPPPPPPKASGILEKITRAVLFGGITASLLISGRK